MTKTEIPSIINKSKFVKKAKNSTDVSKTVSNEIETNTMNEKDTSLNKEEDLSTNSDADVSSNDESTNCDKDASERPKHDALIRKALENPIVVKEFFEMHLPQETKDLFSPHTLKMEKESFVEADLKHSISDILFSAKFKDNTGYLWILLEHQSTPDLNSWLLDLP